MSAYRTQAPGDGSLRGFLGAVLIGLVLAAPLMAAVKAGQAPAAYVQILVDDAGSAASFEAMNHLVNHPDAAAARAAVDAALADASDLERAQLAGVRVALGEVPDNSSARAAALEYLEGADPAAKRLVLEALAVARARDEALASEVLPALTQDPDANVQNAAQRALAHQDSMKSSGLMTFLALIALTIVGAVIYGASFATELDPMKGLIQDWTAKPADREDILKKVKAEEDHVDKLLAYFGNSTLSSIEIAGLLDMISHFDQDAVHEKLYEMAQSKNDALKSAAIQAMYRLEDPRWEGVLVDYVNCEDEVAQYAAAKALAERGAVGQLPLLRQKLEASVPGSVQDGLRDAIERLEVAERAQRGAAE